jgi:hypothetical protein
MIPKAEPTSTDLMVNSFMFVSEETKGWNFLLDMTAILVKGR